MEDIGETITDLFEAIQDAISSHDFSEMIDAIRGIFSELKDKWHDLDKSQQQMITLVVSGVLFAIALGPQIAALIAAGFALCYHFSLTKPSMESFAPFFEQWFKQVYYPRIADDVQSRLDSKHRQSRNNVVSILKTTASTLIHQTTKGLQADFLFELVKQREKKVSDYRAFWLVTIDLGEKKKSNKQRFIGYNGNWKWIEPNALTGHIDHFAQMIEQEQHRPASKRNEEVVYAQPVEYDEFVHFDDEE